MAEEQPPTGPEVVEREAEESGNEAGSGDEEEECDATIAADLGDFIADEGEEAAAKEEAAKDGEGESSDSEFDDNQELTADDLQVLREAGLETDQLVATSEPKRKRDDKDALEGESKRAKKDDEDDLADIFGDFDGDDDAAPAGGGAKASGDFDDLSEGESVDNFIVEDRDAKRRRMADEAAELNISEEQLQEVVDIFGSTDVLKPIDEMDNLQAEEAAPKPPTEAAGTAAAMTPMLGAAVTPARIASPASGAAGTPALGAAMSPALGAAMTPTTSMALMPKNQIDSQALELGADPSLLEKTYGTGSDRQLEQMDVPERWHQTYIQPYSELLNGLGVRDWTDEEHECESIWIYNEEFRNKHGYEQEPVTAAIRKILNMLHFQRLEPVYILRQHQWEYSKIFYTNEILRIADLDRKWQNIWLLYKRIIGLVHKIGDEQVHNFIKDKANRTIFFESSNPEIELQDCYLWFCTMCPQEISSGTKGLRQLSQSEAQKMSLVRKARFDEKLGISNSITQMSLQAFGITPMELGLNILHYQERGEQLHKPILEEQITVRELCAAHVSEDFSTPEAVQEAIMLYLSRLIACDPRVRKWVRSWFVNLCAVSTYVTELGKPASYEAANSFSTSYRAFHLVCRPIDTFDGQLYLDVVDLERKGFIRVEYCLVQRDKLTIDKNHAEWEKRQWSYKYIIPGHDADGVGKAIQTLQQHDKRRQAGFIPVLDQDVMKWNWCEAMRPKLDQVARAHEIPGRLEATASKDGKEKQRAQVLFKVAGKGMKITADSMTKFLVEDPIFTGMVKAYCNIELMGEREVFVVPGEWTDMRKNVLLRALRDELYPALWTEMQAKLLQDAEQEVCQTCCDQLTKIIDVQPFKLAEDELRQALELRRIQQYGPDYDETLALREDDDEEWTREKKTREAGIFSVMVVNRDVGDKKNERGFFEASETCSVAVVNGYGDPLDMRILFSDFYKRENDKDIDIVRRKNTSPVLMTQAMRIEKRLEHGRAFRSMLKRYKPAIILVMVCEKDSDRLKRSLEDLLIEEDVKESFVIAPRVRYASPVIPRIVAYTSSLSNEGAYRDCDSPQFRAALSAARFIQDPLAETSQLWHEDPVLNGVLSIKLHRLQHAVARDRLLHALTVPFMETVAKAGIHVNRIRRSAHLLASAQFAPGLGPRKVRCFQRCIVADAVTSRNTFAQKFIRYLQCEASVQDDPLRSPVVQNVLPFLKLSPDLRDAATLDFKIPGLDMTRLGDSFAPWIQPLCKAGMRNRDEEFDAEIFGAISDDYVKQSIEVERRTKSMVEILRNQEDTTNDWPNLAGVAMPPDCDLDTLLQELVEEIQEPFRDQRAFYAEMDEETAFFLMIGGSPDTLKVGSLVHATVDSDGMYPRVDENGKELKEKKQSVNCLISPGMMNGSFNKKTDLTDAGKYLPGCDRRFTRGEPVVARISRINYRNVRMDISVDTDSELWESKFPVRDTIDAVYFLPHESENWVDVKLGWVNADAKIQMSKHKEWVNRPRNIRHTNWHNSDFTHALTIMDKVPLNFVLFRPSKRHDIILAMLKVHDTAGENNRTPDKCFRSFDVYEKGNKDVQSGFEIARELEVDGTVYNDLDEIIARHMDPIAENLRLLQEHEHWGLHRGLIIEKKDVVEGIQTLSSNDKRMLYYSFIMHETIVGHGEMIWSMAGKKPYEDFIEVTPRGFVFWNQHFETLKAMMHWFKSVGWRNAKRCRKEFVEQWGQRCKEAKAKRGIDCREGEKQRVTAYSFDQRVSGSGLATPVGGNITPTLYTAEAAAPTPSGLFTPSGVAPSTPAGNRTPRGVPSTPGGSNFGAPATPAGVGVPGTPSRFAAPSTPSGMRTPSKAPEALRFNAAGAPITPAALRAPGTPAALLGQSAGATPRPAAGTPMPQTPVGASRTPIPGRQPMTPAGAGGYGGMPATPGTVPMTPGGAFASYNPVPQTPRGAFGAVPSTPGAAVPSTPGRAVPSTPRGAFMTGNRAVPLTPSSAAVPMTPAGAFRSAFAAPVTPAGAGAAMPMTPGGARGGAAVPMTPSGAAVPSTPAGAGRGAAVPMTPSGAAVPSTPAGAGRGAAVPMTPSGAAVPSTPAGAGRGAAVPMTPSGAAVPSTPAGAGRGQVKSETNAPGAIPMTPMAAPKSSRGVPLTPRGAMPSTPRGLVPGATPFGAPPQTPHGLSAGPPGAVPQTPRGLVPGATPAGPPPAGPSMPQTPRGLVPGATPAGAPPRTPGAPQTPRGLVPGATPRGPPPATPGVLPPTSPDLGKQESKSEV